MITDCNVQIFEREIFSGCLYFLLPVLRKLLSYKKVDQCIP